MIIKCVLLVFCKDSRFILYSQAFSNIFFEIFILGLDSERAWHERAMMISPLTATKKRLYEKNRSPEAEKPGSTVTSFNT